MINFAGFSETRAVSVQSLAVAFWSTLIASMALALLTVYWHVQCWHLWSFAWRMVTATFEVGSTLPLVLGLATFAVIGVMPVVIFVALMKRLWRLGSLYRAGGWVEKEYADKFVTLSICAGGVVVLGLVLAWVSPWPVLTSYLLVLSVWGGYLSLLDKLV